jgi:hypothetical protein
LRSSPTRRLNFQAQSTKHGFRFDLQLVFTFFFLTLHYTRKGIGRGEGSGEINKKGKRLSGFSLGFLLLLLLLLRSSAGSIEVRHRRPRLRIPAAAPSYSGHRSFAAAMLDPLAAGLVL